MCSVLLLLLTSSQDWHPHIHLHLHMAVHHSTSFGMAGVDTPCADMCLLGVHELHVLGYKIRPPEVSQHCVQTIKEVATILQLTSKRSPLALASRVNDSVPETMSGKEDLGPKRLSSHDALH